MWQWNWLFGLCSVSIIILILSVLNCLSCPQISQYPYTPPLHWSLPPLTSWMKSDMAPHPPLSLSPAPFFNFCSWTSADLVSNLIDFLNQHAHIITVLTENLQNSNIYKHYSSNYWKRSFKFPFERPLPIFQSTWKIFLKISMFPMHWFYWFPEKKLSQAHSCVSQHGNFKEASLYLNFYMLLSFSL